MVDRSGFLRDMNVHYPELDSELSKHEGMLEWEVTVFLKYIQSKIDSGDQLNSRILMERADRYYRTGDIALKEFIRNGVCEDMRFEDSKKVSRAWSKKFLSPALSKERELWIDFMGEKYRR